MMPQGWNVPTLRCVAPFSKGLPPLAPPQGSEAIVASYISINIALGKLTVFNTSVMAHRKRWYRELSRFFPVYAFAKSGGLEPQKLAVVGHVEVVESAGTDRNG